MTAAQKGDREGMNELEKQLYEALVVVREWLWGGKLDPQQKPGAPIIAPGDVIAVVNGALDAAEEAKNKESAHEHD